MTRVGGLEVAVERGRLDVLTVRGEVDVNTVPRLREALGEAVAEGSGALVVDLSAVSFIDSSGLSALLNALRRLTRAGRRLALVVSDGPVANVLRLTRLHGTFDVYARRREAIRAVQP